ncbi:efflux RND transporter periplasmic adaptor subunit [Parachryseolinea silvisoli]|uniref:efflux RND transporter periplasmic adaptor subunit n=1 Tax=Parachryseolinea silvisoli TaxID=2873601 RepID=UPI002265F682|nr:efflux RND transporter periplasmic adaptor subunit [Parachryseolinea silvisoli]MCD9017992.1 efflux RND transporter periplasmic adaptor subunit [Parachryseolinea silvisoli]
MKNNWRNKLSLPIMLLPLLVLVASCNKGGEHAEHADTYTCPMHPTAISDKPGTCPVCGMDLVRKARPGEEVEITEDLSKLIKSPSETVIASIKTIKGEYMSMPVSTEAQGVVTYDTRNVYTIPTRIGGRLEKVFLKYAFQQVRKGQKVAEIYSPELLTAQRELLFVIENDSKNEALIQSAKERLKLLGATDAQINDLIQSKNPKNTFAIYSTYDGYVLADGQQTPIAPMTSPRASTSAGGMTDGMSGNASTSPSTSASSAVSKSDQLIREGSYVTSGQTLFKVVNPSALRVELNIASTLTATVKKGSKVKLDFGDEHRDDGTIDFVQPFFNEGQEFLTVRVYTKNTERLHIGHLVKAVIESSAVEALWVPKEAVLHLGVDDVVFVKEKNVFRPKKVVTGIRTEKHIEIKQGLSSSDEIASNGQYLVDSESFIKTNK